jgi:TRAP-type C4-dicarboxylate transport system permease small subunit
MFGSATSSGSGPSFGGRLAAIHDAITRFGFYCAAACLAVIVCAYTYEVVARYLFSAPTAWASSLVAYLLCYLVFLAMPELTRDRVHIFISIVLDSAPLRYATALQHLTYVIAAVACAVAAVFCFDATWDQYVGGISTVNEWRVPKWALSVSIPYGLFSTAIYFARLVLSRAPYQSSEAL